MPSLLRSFFLRRVHNGLLSETSTIALTKATDVLLLLLCLNFQWCHFTDNLKGLSLIIGLGNGGIRHTIGKSRMLSS